MERKLLNKNDINVALATLDGWTHDDNHLKRKFTFENFAESLDFVNRVGALAEASMFSKDPENAALWEGRRDKVYQSIKSMDFHYREMAAPRTMGYTP